MGLSDPRVCGECVWGKGALGIRVPLQPLHDVLEHARALQLVEDLVQQARVLHEALVGAAQARQERAGARHAADLVVRPVHDEHREGDAGGARQRPVCALQHLVRDAHVRAAVVVEGAEEKGWAGGGGVGGGQRRRRRRSLAAVLRYDLSVVREALRDHGHQRELRERGASRSERCTQPPTTLRTFGMQLLRRPTT